MVAQYELSVDWLARSVAEQGGSVLVLLLGAPASGKSTLAKYFERLKFTRLSMDDIREELFGTATSNSSKVNKIFAQRLKQALEKQGPVLIDNANCYRSSRDEIIKEARQAGYQRIWLLAMDVPVDVCLARNKQRSRQVPEIAIRKLNKELHGAGKPSAEEGLLLWLMPGSDSEHIKIRSL